MKVQRTVRFLVRLFSRDQRVGISILNVAKALYMFFPNTSGSYQKLSRMALYEVNRVIPLLSQFSKKEFTEIPISSFQSTYLAESLDSLMRKYGSDKSSGHNYHLVYASLINPLEIRKVLEIGIGSNNPRVASNMGKSGRPGASLRAFREFFPKARIIGLEFDKTILFDEDRIETYFVNSLDKTSFEEISLSVGGDFDIMIDDGLHSLVSSLNSLDFFLHKIKVGGFAIIEDIPESAFSVYKTVAGLIGDDYDCRLYKDNTSFMFVVQRKY